jgi:hypothetical protein
LKHVCREVPESASECIERKNRVTNRPLRAFHPAMKTSRTLFAARRCMLADKQVLAVPVAK